MSNALFSKTISNSLFSYLAFLHTLHALWKNGLFWILVSKMFVNDFIAVSFLVSWIDLMDAVTWTPWRPCPILNAVSSNFSLYWCWNFLTPIFWIGLTTRVLYAVSLSCAFVISFQRFKITADCRASVAHRSILQVLYVVYSLGACSFNVHDVPLVRSNFSTFTVLLLQ